MSEMKAFELVKRYITGWKQNNIELITSCLTENCVIIESHGPTYQGILNVKKWFEFWLKANGKITIWDINSFSFCEKEQTTFCEWHFNCTSKDTEYNLIGISVVKYNDQKISFIHEYRMSQPAYKWQGDELKSE